MTWEAREGLMTCGVAGGGWPCLGDSVLACRLGGQGL